MRGKTRHIKGYLSNLRLGREFTCKEIAKEMDDGNYYITSNTIARYVNSMGIFIRFRYDRDERCWVYKKVR